MKRAIFLFTTIALIVIAILSYFWVTSANDYTNSRHVEVSINDELIFIYRDEYGTPYVVAESKADAIRGQGFVQAQDRLFQIEFYRAYIRGELSSILGASMLPTDIKMRVLNIPANAKRNYQYLNKESRDFLSWYCEGFNEYLKVGENEFPIELWLLGFSPKPITPEEMLAAIHFVGYNHAKNIDDEILSLNLAASTGHAPELLPLNINPDRIDMPAWPIMPMQPTGGAKIVGQWQRPVSTLLPAPRLGSNNCAVAGAKTVSGKPILANDPHLDARMLPGIFYPIGLFCPSFEAVGVSLPAMPGIIVGRNKHVAFGVTNAYGDSQDLYIEQTNGNTYLHHGKQIPFESRTETIDIKDSTSVTINVRTTVRGPIISDFDVFGIMTDDVVSFRWSLAGSQSASLGIERFLEANTTTEFRQAVSDIDNMFFNFVMADTKGNIAHQASGLIPVRAGQQGATPSIVDSTDNWLGYIPKNEMPHMVNPERNWVGTANHDTRPDGYPYYYSSHFAPNYRYLRMQEILSTNKKLNRHDLWELVLDCKNMQAQRLAPLYADALAKDEGTKGLADILANWNYHDDKDLVAPTIYHLLADVLQNLLLDDELPDLLEEAFWANGYYWEQSLDRIISENHPFVDDTRTPERESLESLVIVAGKHAKAILTERFGPNMTKWKWGMAHTVSFYSPLRRSGIGSKWLGAETLPKNGSNQTINRGGYTKNKDRSLETAWFSTFRMVADLDDDEKIMAVLSGGSAARVFHPFYKSQLATWHAEEWIPYWLSKDKATAGLPHLVLR